MSDNTRASTAVFRRTTSRERANFGFSRTSLESWQRRHRNRLRSQPSGGARRDRTDDLLLAKQALSQLSYGPVPVGCGKSVLTGLPSRSSPRRDRPPSSFDYGVAAFATLRERRLVGLGRLELPTSRLSSARSNQLSYKPEPGVSGQKPAIRNESDRRILMTDSWSARSRRKRNEDGGVLQMGTSILRSKEP